MIKNILTFLVFIGVIQVLTGQVMTNKKLEDILIKVTDTVNGYPGYWEVIHRDRQLICLTDETHNRMRIISPISETDTLNKELLLDLMTANFHAALDVKYAISNGFLWSVYIHPLKELHENEVVSALEQVVNAVKNYGTTFSSTEMIFGSKHSQEKEQSVEEKPILEKL